MGKHVREVLRTIVRFITHSRSSSRPGFIAGVTNPIFESAGSWDLLCDIGNGRLVVHKDIYANWPVSAPPLPPGGILVRTGTMKGEVAGSEEDVGRTSSQLNNLGPRSEFSGKVDSADNVFMDDVSID